MAKLIEMRALALKFLGLAGLFIILSSAISADSARLTQEGFRYSTYLATLPEAKNANNFQGSFIVQTQPTGLFHTTAQNIYTEASAEISDLPIRESILGYLIDNKEVTYDYETVWRTRGWNVIRSATNNALLSATESSRRTGFIRTLELDVQSELGGRRANVGLSALGGLRETDNDVIAWQLRGYRTSDDAGANAGLIYRRATENNLLVGANVFLDYETHDVENFWRYSIGGELRSPWVDIFANTYIGITDPVESSEGTTYTSDGHDVELNVHSPDISWLTGKVTYYNFSGEFGDEDEEGVRFGLKFSPRQVPFVLEIEYEDAESGDESVGGRISYTHEFGASNSGRAGHSGKFTPRDWFYAPVEREYTQRIRTGGGGSNSRSITLIAGGVPAGFRVRINNALGLDITISRAQTGTSLYVISGTGENTVTLQPPRLTIGATPESLVWPIPTEAEVRLRYDTTAPTPLIVKLLNGAITSYIGSTVVMGRDYIGLEDGRITVATGGGFTGGFMAFQGASTVTADIDRGVIISVAATVSFEDSGDIELFSGSPTFIIDGRPLGADCNTQITMIDGIAFHCPIAAPVFAVSSSSYIPEPDTSLLRVQSSGNLGAQITYLENRNPRLDIPFARLMTVNGGSGNRIEYTAVGDPTNIRVEPNGEIFLVDPALTVTFPRGPNVRNQVRINIEARDTVVHATVIAPLTVAYIVDVNSQNITPFAVNLLGASRSVVPQNGNVQASPTSVPDAVNGQTLVIANINANGGIIGVAGDDYRYTRLVSNAPTTDNTPTDNLNLAGSQIVIPVITEDSGILEGSVLGITVLVEDIADATDYTNNYILTLFVELGPIRTDPIEIEFTPSSTYEGTTTDGAFRYNVAGNNIRINYPFDSLLRSQSASEEHRDLGRVAMTGGSGRRDTEIQSNGSGIDADIVAGVGADANDGIVLNIRIPATSGEVDTGRWTVRVTASDPFIQSSRALLPNETAEYIIDAIQDIGGVADERAASAPENSIVQRDGAYRYRYFTAIATLNGINASDYPQDVVQLGEGEGGRGIIRSELVSSNAPLTYNPATRIISFASEPAANNYEIVVRYTDTDSAARTNPFLVTVNITSNNDLVNITLGSVTDSIVSGNVIRTPLLDVADPRGHIANIGLSNVTVGGDLLLNPERISSLEYDQGVDLTTGMIFSPDDQFAGGVIDYANEVVRHSIFINAIDNEISVTISYEIRAELTFATPVPDPLEGRAAFADSASGIRYDYSGDHDNGIRIRVNYPYNSDWAIGPSGTQRTFINIGGEVSVFIDPADQAVFAYDSSAGAIRVLSATPPAETEAPYTISYVPYNSAKGLNGITNEITFLAVEDIGGVTDEVDADAPPGGVVQRSGDYSYGYFIALSTLGDITTDYPHTAVQLGTGNGGSGNIRSSMVSSSDSRVTYNPTDRKIRFTSVPVESEDYIVVVAFTDTQAGNNRAIPYTVTVNILANNDLVNIGLSSKGDEISGNVITTALLDISAPRTAIATVSLVDVVNGSLALDPDGDNSLEYEAIDEQSGMIFLPDDLLTVVGIDYANEVVRHQLVLLATDTDLGVVDISRPIVVLLTFATPTGDPEPTDSTYEVDGRRYTYSNSGNEISIRVNYPSSGPNSGAWAGEASSGSTFSDILRLDEAVVDFGDVDGPSDAVFERVSDAVRLTSVLAPENTVEEYTFTYFPRNDAKGLVGVTTAVRFVAVPDITATAVLNSLPYIDGGNGVFRYLIPVALTATGPIVGEPIITFAPSGGNGNSYVSELVDGALPSVLEYDPNTFELSFASEITLGSPLINTRLEVRIAFSERDNTGIEAATYTSIITIEPTTVALDVYIREPNSLVEIADYSINPSLPIGATTFDRVEIGNVRFRDRSVGGVVTKITGSLGYDDDDDRRIFIPAGNLITSGILDYANDVVRHSIVLLARDPGTGTERLIVYTIDYTFSQPQIQLEANGMFYGRPVSNNRNELNLDYTATFGVGGDPRVVEGGRQEVRINYPVGRPSFRGPEHRPTQSAYFHIRREGGFGYRILNDRDGSFVDTDQSNVAIQIGDVDNFIRTDYNGTQNRIVAARTPADTSQPFDVRIVPYDNFSGLEGLTVTVRIFLVEDITASSSLASNALVSAAVTGDSGLYRYSIPDAPSGGETGPIIDIIGEGGTGVYESRAISRTPNLGYDANNHQVTYASIPDGRDVDVITVGIRDIDPSSSGRNEVTIGITIVAVDNTELATYSHLNGIPINNNLLELNIADVPSNRIIATLGLGDGVVLRFDAELEQVGPNARLTDDGIVELPSGNLFESLGAQNNKVDGFLDFVYSAIVRRTGTSFDTTRNLIVRIHYAPLRINAVHRGVDYDSRGNVSFAGEEHITFNINNNTNELELIYADGFWELDYLATVNEFTNHRNPVLFELLGGSGQGDRNVRRVDFVSLTPTPPAPFTISRFSITDINSSGTTNGFGYFHGTGGRDTTALGTGFGEFDDGRRLAFYIPATREIGVPSYQGPYTLSLTAFDNNYGLTVTASYTFNALDRTPLRIGDFEDPRAPSTSGAPGFYQNMNNANEFRLIQSELRNFTFIRAPVSGGVGIYEPVYIHSPLLENFRLNTGGLSIPRGDNALLYFFDSRFGGFPPPVGVYSITVQYVNEDPSLSSTNSSHDFVLDVVAERSIDGRIIAISPEGVTNRVTNINGTTLSLNLGERSMRTPIAYIDTPQDSGGNIPDHIGELGIAALDDRTIILPNLYPLGTGVTDAANNVIRSSIIISLPDNLYGFGTLTLSLFVETHVDDDERIVFNEDSSFEATVLGIATRIEFDQLSRGAFRVRYPSGSNWNRNESRVAPGNFTDALGEDVTATNVGGITFNAKSIAGVDRLEMTFTDPGPTGSTVILFTLNVGGQEFPYTLFVVEEIEQAFVTVVATAGIRSGQTAIGETFYRMVPSLLGGIGAPAFRISIEGGSNNYDINAILLGSDLDTSNGIEIDRVAGSDVNWDIAFTRTLPLLTPAEFHAGRVYTLQIAVEDSNDAFSVTSNTLTILIAPTEFADAGVEVYVDGSVVAEHLIEHPLFALGLEEDIPNLLVASVSYRPGAIIQSMRNGTTVTLSLSVPPANYLVDFIQTDGLIQFHRSNSQRSVGDRIDVTNNIIYYDVTIAIDDPTSFVGEELITLRASASYTRPTIIANADDLTGSYFADAGIQRIVSGNTVRLIYNQGEAWFNVNLDPSARVPFGFRISGGSIGSYISVENNEPLHLRGGESGAITYRNGVGISSLNNDQVFIVLDPDVQRPPSSFEIYTVTMSVGLEHSPETLVVDEQEFIFEAIEAIGATRATIGQLGDNTNDAGYNYDFVRPYDLRGVTVFRYSIPTAEFDEPAFRISVGGGRGSYTGSARLVGQPAVRLRVEAVSGETDMFDVTFLNSPAPVDEADFINELVPQSDLVISFRDDILSADEGGLTQITIGILATDFLYSGYLRDGNLNGNFGTAITVSLDYADYVAGARIANLETRAGGGEYTGGTGDALRGIAVNFANGNVTLAPLETYLAQADVDISTNVLVEETTIQISDASIFSDGVGVDGPNGGSEDGAQAMVIRLEVHYNPATISFESAELFDGRNPTILDDSLQASRTLELTYPSGSEWNHGSSPLQQRGGAFTFTQGEGDLGERATDQTLEAGLTSGSGITFDTVVESGNQVLRMNFVGTAPTGTTTYQIEVDLVDPVAGVIDRQVFDLRIVEGP